MEINVNIAKEQDKKNNYQKQLLTLIGIILVLLLFIYTIYLIERYIFFTPIYFILKLLFFILFNIENIKKFLIIISVIFVVILHIFLIKIIILSIIFLLGGLFAKFSFYDNFVNFINEQNKLAKIAIDSLYFSLNDFSKNDLIYAMSKITMFHTAYNNLKMIKNATFEIKKYQIGEYLNEAIYQYNKYKDEDYSSDEIKNNLINSLKLYRKNLQLYTNFSFIDIIMKFNYKNFLLFLNELIQNSFKGRSCDYKKIYNNFNVYIISPEVKNSDIKTLVIFCGQNACNAEMFSFSQNHIKFYLNIKEITLLIWNYKGYGLRAGFPTFRSMDRDVEILKEYIRNNYSDYKIIIHGISIGGYPAIKLAKNLNNKNICLIVDRTFANIDLIAETFMKKGRLFYNILFPKFFYNSDNIQNYIDVLIGNKIILFDEEDDIINYYQSSLIYNLTEKYYNEIILPKISDYPQYKTLINLISGNYNNLRIELKRIINNKSNKLDDNTVTLIKHINRNINNLDKFIMFFLIFGYPFNIYKEINYDKIVFAKNYINLPEIIRKIYDNNKNKFNENIIKFISNLNFLFIKSNLIIPFNDEEIINFTYNNDNNEFGLQEGLQENLLKYFGYVHRIFCNHNGYLEDKDEKYLRKYFELNEFINDSNTKEKSNEDVI